MKKIELHKQPYFGNYSLDSCKLSIPIEKIEVIDYKRLDSLQVIELETGDILKLDNYLILRDNKEVSTKQSFVYAGENGISFKIFHFRNPKTQKESLSFQINSKILKDGYFQGITAENKKIVYDFIIAQNVVYFDYKTFNLGTLSGWDWKKDFYANNSNFNELNQNLYNAQNYIKSVGLKPPINKKLHKALYFNKRGDDTTRTNPYLKFYQVGLEKQNRKHSKKFFEKYLAESHSIDYLSNFINRFEFTINNNEMFKKFLKRSNNEVVPNTLESILDLSQEVIGDIAKEVMKTYYNTSETKIMNSKNIKNFDKLSAKEKYIYDKIQTLLNAGYTYNLIETEILDNVIGKKAKNQRHKEKQIIKKIYDNYFLNTELEQQNIETQKSMDFIADLVGLQILPNRVSLQ